NLQFLSFPRQVADHATHRHRVPLLWSLRRDAQDAGVEAFDVLGGFFAFEAEDHLAGAHRLAVFLQPAEEDAFLHVPAEAGGGDPSRPARFACRYSTSKMRIAWGVWSPAGTPAASSGGLYGVGGWTPLSRRIGASRSSKPRSASWAAISAPMP